MTPTMLAALNVLLGSILGAYLMWVLMVRRSKKTGDKG